ncbi:MAG: hypothetical protein M1531_07035 [Chloroflexi bacterium]|nr:hypothetical protein [Chloroflexota bacterium]
MKRAKRLAPLIILLICVAVLGTLLVVPPPAARAGVGFWSSSGPADIIGTVAVAPGNGQVVYAIGQQGLWKTADGGSTWSLAGAAKLNSYAPIAVDPTNASALYSGGTDTLRGIVKSTDGGGSWAVLRPNVDATALAVDPTRPNIIYAGVVTGGSMQLLKSFDSGATWAAVTNQYVASPGIPSVVGIAVDPSRPDTVYAALQSYHTGFVLRTDNGGANWMTLSTGSMVPLMLPTALAISPSTGGSSRVYVAWGLMGSKALLRSSDNGNTWQNVTPNLPSGGASITSLVVPDTSATVVAAISGVLPSTGVPGGVYISLNAGDSWALLAPLAQNPNKLALGGDSLTLHAGTDNGVWEYTTPPGGLQRPVDPRFRSYYDTHDGLRVLGAPVSSPTMVGKYYSQYFEKGRIEDHTGESPDPNWQFMYGLLVDELQQGGSGLPVGGDASTVTYATVRGQAAPNLRVPPPPGFTGGTAYQPDGSMFIPFTADLSPANGHNVFGPFWDYINRGDLFPGGWLHDIGLPITEPTGAVVDKGNVKGRQIIIQAFQRTILTYDPLNPLEWQVERANVGTDYRKAFPGRVPN